MNRLVEILEREAGHILVGLLLIPVGAALWLVGVPKGDDLVPFALGLLARSMVSEKDGKK